jgi:hypothetical protein
MESLYFHPDDDISGKLSVPSPLQPQLLNSKDTLSATPPPTGNNIGDPIDPLANQLKRKHAEMSAATTTAEAAVA